ncbi:MAG: DUF1559 domain-containing protein, partial [Planctomycetota bacterium]
SGNRIARSLWTGRGQHDDSLAAATTDYNAAEGVVWEGVCQLPGAWGEVIPAAVPWHDPEIRELSFKDVTDGLSNTLMIVERAGLPDRYFDGGERHEPHEPPKGTWGNVGLWAVSAESTLNHLAISDNLSPVNRDNLTTLFSFHPGIALVAFADGSVQTLSDSLDNETLVALVSRDIGDTCDRSALR